MKAIFYNSFIQDLAKNGNIEIKHFALGKNVNPNNLEATGENISQKFDLSSSWDPSKKLLKLSLLFRELTNEYGDKFTEVDRFGECNIIYVYYAIFDKENKEENIAFVIVDETEIRDAQNNILGITYSSLNLDSQRNFINLPITFDVNSRIFTKIMELESDVEFLEGAGIEVGENLFRMDNEDDSIVSVDSYRKYLLSKQTDTRIYGPNTTTGLDITGKNVDITKYRKIYKEDTFVLGVFDETNFINISDEIKTKYNLPRDISYESSSIGGESDKGVYRTVKLTGCIEYDLYYDGEHGLEYICTKTEEITGIDGVRIVNVESGDGFTYEIDNLLYNVRYFTPEGVDIDDPVINPYGIFVLELTYTDTDGSIKTIHSNKLRLIQGGYYGYFSVISRDSTYMNPADDAAMYLFNRKKGERKYFTIRVKSSIFTEYWESEDTSKIKSNITFEFENDYMEAELKKLFNFSYTIDKLEHLEDIFDITVEILSLKNNDDEEHWLPYCDPDGDGVNESTLSMIKLNVDLDSSVNMYFERFYCAQGCQANSIVLVDLNIPDFSRAQINPTTGLVYRNDETEKTISITEEYDDQEDIELGNVPFYWKVITLPEELTITPVDSSEAILSGEGEFNYLVSDYYSSTGNNRPTILSNKFRLDFDYSKFLGVFQLPETLTILKQTQEEYQNDVEVEDTWETYLTHNVLKIPVKKEGLRPYVDIEGSSLNEKKTELVLDLNTNPIRVEKVRINYNATMTVRFVYSDESVKTKAPYKFWNGVNEVDELVIENLSGEEEHTDLFIVIKEAGKWSRDYTGAKIEFIYKTGIGDSEIKINSHDNFPTYIELTEGALDRSTYSLEFTEFIFSQEPGPGIGVGFVKRELSGYISEAGNKVDPVYDSINYLNDVPASSKAVTSDIFVPKDSVAAGEYQLESHFKSSVSWELNIDRQNIVDYNIETGVVFGINELTNEYEYKYHYIKYKDTSNRQLSYPADTFDVLVSINLYNYSSNTFTASKLRLWLQRVSNEVIVSSNSDLAGLSYRNIDDSDRIIVDSAVVYGVNNINEAYAYLPDSLFECNDEKPYLNTAYIGYHSTEDTSATSTASNITHTLVKKYAGENDDLYIVLDDRIFDGSEEENVYPNKVNLKLKTSLWGNRDLNSLLKVTGEIDSWDNNSIIIHEPIKSITHYLAGYVLRLPNNRDAKFELSEKSEDITQIFCHKFIKTGDTDSKTYYANWYNETGYTNGDYVITSSDGNPGDDIYAYYVGDYENRAGVVQLRTTQKYDSELITTNSDFIKIGNSGSGYYILQEGNNWKIYKKYDNPSGLSEDTEFVRDITNECTGLLTNGNFISQDADSVSGPDQPGTDDNVDLSELPETRSWYYLKFKHGDNTISGQDKLHLDSKAFSLIYGENSSFELPFTEMVFSENYGLVNKSAVKDPVLGDILIYTGANGVDFNTNNDPTNFYWVETKTGLAFKAVNSKYGYSRASEDGSSTTISGVNNLGGMYYVKPKSTYIGKSITYSKNSNDVYELSLDGVKLTPALPKWNSTVSNTIIHKIDSSESGYFTLDPGYLKPGNESLIIKTATGGPVWDGTGVPRSNVKSLYGPTLNWLVDNNNISTDIDGCQVSITSNTNRTGFYYNGSVFTEEGSFTNDELVPSTGGPKACFASSSDFTTGDLRLVIAVTRIVHVSGSGNPHENDWERAEKGIIYYVKLKPELAFKYFVLNNSTYDKLYSQETKNVSPIEDVSQFNFLVGRIEFTGDTSNRFRVTGLIPYNTINVQTPDPNSLNFNPAYTTLSEFDEALTTNTKTTSISYVTGTYYYPYLDKDTGEIKEISLGETTNFPSKDGISLSYSKSFKRYQGICWKRNKLAGDGNYCLGVSTAPGSLSSYNVYNLLDTRSTGSIKYYYAFKASTIYLDLYRIVTNTPNATFYVQDEVPAYYGDSADGVRRTVTYQDYLSKGISVDSYFDWCSPILIIQAGFGTSFAAIDSIRDGQFDVTEVVNTAETTNHQTLTKLISGYKYVLYNNDKNNPYTIYYALSPYEFNSPDRVFFSDKTCTEPVQNVPSIDSTFNRLKVYAINTFTSDIIKNGDIQSNFVENGMGHPNRFETGSKYFVDFSTQGKPDVELFEVYAGGESSTKIAIMKVSNIELLGYDLSEPTLNSFQFSFIFHKVSSLGSESRYYVCTSKDDGIDQLSEQIGDTIEEKYFNLCLNNTEKIIVEGESVDNPDYSPFIGQLYEYDNKDLGRRPKTNLMYPVSQGLDEDPQPVYHLDRSEINRGLDRWVDYVTIEKPEAGTEVDLYTVDYNKTKYDWDDNRYEKNWNKKIKPTGKKVEFGNVLSLPSNELWLFRYKYTTDSEQRVFLPIPEGLNSNDIYKDNFIGNQEKELTAVVKNDNCKISIPDYTFTSNGGELDKNISITRGYLIDMDDDSYSRGKFPESTTSLKWADRVPNEAYWSSYLGHENRALSIELPDRYQNSHPSGNVISNVSDIVDNINSGANNNGKLTFIPVSWNSSLPAPKFKITQKGIGYQLKFRFYNSPSWEYWAGSDNFRNTEDIGNISDRAEYLNFYADLITSYGTRANGELSIQVYEDNYNIINRISSTRNYYNESSPTVWTISLNRNKTRSNRTCKLRFTNLVDSNTTTLILEITQKGIESELLVSFRPITYKNESVIADNEIVHFSADGTIIPSGDTVLKDVSENGVLYIRTDIFNEIVDNTQYTLKEMKNEIYKRLEIEYKKPIFYEVAVIDSSRGNLYYTGEEYDDVYRTYKLINVSTLPEIYYQSVNDNQGSLEIKGDLIPISKLGIKPPRVTRSFNVKHDYFVLEFTPCSIWAQPSGSYFIKTPYAVGTDGEGYYASYINEGTRYFDEPEIYWNDNVIDNRPDNYTLSLYKNERNPDFYNHMEGLKVTPYKELGSRTLDTNSPIMLPINYICVSIYKWELVSDGNTSTWVQQAGVKLKNVKITSDVSVKAYDSDPITPTNFSNILQGVLSGVSFDIAPESVHLGNIGDFYNTGEDKDNIMLLNYEKRTENDIIMRQILSLEYKDRTLKFPFKCNIFVYYKL
jgi:hypothetical protein